MRTFVFIVSMTGKGEDEESAYNEAVVNFAQNPSPPDPIKSIEVDTDKDMEIYVPYLEL